MLFDNVSRKPASEAAEPLLMSLSRTKGEIPSPKDGREIIMPYAGTLRDSKLYGGNNKHSICKV